MRGPGPASGARRRGLRSLCRGLAAGGLSAKGLFTDGRTVVFDAGDYFYPSWNFISRLWRDQTVPLWNPFLFNGYPIVAEPQAQVFYPPAFLTSLLSELTPRVLYAKTVL